jgi:molecular chaperone GrpE (heat shock protein)
MPTGMRQTPTADHGDKTMSNIGNSFKSWTSGQFIDLIQKVVALKGSTPVNLVADEELEKQIQSIIDGKKEKIVIGRTNSEKPAVAPPVGSDPVNELERLAAKLDRVEAQMKAADEEFRRKQQEAAQAERRAKREVQQKIRDRLAKSLCEEWAHDDSERRLIVAFQSGSRTEEQLSNIILGTNFRRNFALHHMTSVASAENMAREWDDIDSEELRAYLAADIPDRQKMNALMETRTREDKKGDPAAPVPKVDNKGPLWDVVEEARRAKEQRAQEAEKLAREQLLLEQRRLQAQKDAAELEAIVLDEQRGALGAGEW